MPTHTHTYTVNQYIMNHTFASLVKSSLIAAGFTVSKDDSLGMWQVKDGSDMLLQSRSLGDLMNMSAKEFGL